MLKNILDSYPGLKAIFGDNAYMGLLDGLKIDSNNNLKMHVVKRLDPIKLKPDDPLQLSFIDDKPVVKKPVKMNNIIMMVNFLS